MELKELEPLTLLRIIDKYGPIKGVITLHKLMYNLIKKGLRLRYTFINYSFGPYSKDLDEDLRLLIKCGLVITEGNDSNAIIRLSCKGVKVIKSLSNIKLRDLGIEG